MWKRHWRLTRDPFLDPAGPFVPLAGSSEAVARLVHSIEAGERLAMLRAPAGMGKSRVLAQALTEVRSPARRIARVSGPPDGISLLGALAGSLGVPVPQGVSRADAWKALGEAARLCRWQRLQVVLAIDEAQELTEAVDRRDLDRLPHLDPHPDSRLTLIQVARTDDDAPTAPIPWELTIRLLAFTRGEVERYVIESLRAAGRAEPTFTPRALNVLHACSGGVPRGVARLGSLALMAGAVRGLEMITPEIIEGVALECGNGLSAA